MDPTEHPNHPEKRFLVAGAPTGRFQQGYSDTRKVKGLMPQEPEALDEDDWARHVDREAKQRARALEAGVERDLRLLSTEQRVQEAMVEAKRMRRDVSREFLVWRRLKARGKVDQVEKWTQRIEQIARLGRAA